MSVTSEPVSSKKLAAVQLRTAAILDALERLQLQEGDILLVRDQELMATLAEAEFTGVPKVPLIYAPNGKSDLIRMSKEEYEKSLPKPKRGRPPKKREPEIPPEIPKPPSVPLPQMKSLSEVRRDAALSRWDSVKQEKENWLKPFRELEVSRALSYLEDLRKITEEAGKIINSRMSESKSRQVCVNVLFKLRVATCRKDVSDRQGHGGMLVPGYVWRGVYRDENNPDIMHEYYACSAECQNAFMRKGGGGMGGTN